MRNTRPSELPETPTESMIEAFYFFYFQSVAINMAFMPAHLRGLGLSGSEISTVFSVSPLLSLGVPLAWAWLADEPRSHGWPVST